MRANGKPENPGKRGPKPLPASERRGSEWAFTVRPRQAELAEIERAAKRAKMPRAVWGLWAMLRVARDGR